MGPSDLPPPTAPWCPENGAAGPSCPNPDLNPNPNPNPNPDPDSDPDPDPTLPYHGRMAILWLALATLNGSKKRVSKDIATRRFILSQARLR